MALSVFYFLLELFKILPYFLVLLNKSLKKYPKGVTSILLKEFQKKYIFDNEYKQ